jgi:hypothetical protein
MDEMKNSYKTLVENSKSKRPLGRLGCRWWVSVCIYMQVGNEGLDWLQLAWDVIQWCTVVNMIKNLWRIFE